MSELRVDNIVDMGGSGAPKLRKGVNITGISTITQAVTGNATINAGGINATGVVTSTSNKFVGDFASGNITAGVMTATSSVVASNITINSGGVNASGIVSATSYQGSGANLTGIGLSIAPLSYNPDVSAVDSAVDTGIGITFNQRVSAGTGNVTLSLVSVGSTLVENFGVGSSVTYNNDADPPNITITPTDTLDANTVYAISYPPGAFTQSGAGGSFVGTAYTFDTGAATFGQLWSSGGKNHGNNVFATQRSSPVQTGSASTWKSVVMSGGFVHARKSDNTLWSWGTNEKGELGVNDIVNRSSPIQLPGSWSHISNSVQDRAGGVKTDGTAWSWGDNQYGTLGLNQGGDPSPNTSSPTQIPGTDWSAIEIGTFTSMGVKTDGTLWMWGRNNYGGLGQGEPTNTHRSSPVQVPGTTWTTPIKSDYIAMAFKTDGTLWSWGYNGFGNLGHNDRTNRDSPVQIPGTTWSNIDTKIDAVIATKSDNTLWVWGRNNDGAHGLNQPSDVHYSSPTQIPGTTWADGVSTAGASAIATRTDGTLWNWGMKSSGKLGQNSVVYFSSPVQIPGTQWSGQSRHQAAGGAHYYIKLT